MSTDMDTLAANIRQQMRREYDWIVETEPQDESVWVKLRWIEGFGEGDIPATYSVEQLRGWLKSDFTHEFGLEYDLQELGEPDELRVRPVDDFEEIRGELLEEGRERVEDEWDDEEDIERAHEIIDAIDRSGVEFSRIRMMDLAHKQLKLDGCKSEIEAEQVIDSVMDFLDDDVVEETKVTEWNGNRSWVDKESYSASFILGKGSMARENIFDE
ncbi:hypothetical protein [Halosimplex halobium]|uniref:hypothetical protein n=1 Tax=Halosimplex halobium TaxID=3396618 RepID=UPI003F54B0F1